MVTVSLKAVVASRSRASEMTPVFASISEVAVCVVQQLERMAAAGVRIDDARDAGDVRSFGIGKRRGCCAGR